VAETRLKNTNTFSFLHEVILLATGPTCGKNEHNYEDVSPPRCTPILAGIGSSPKDVDIVKGDEAAICGLVVRIEGYNQRVVRVGQVLRLEQRRHVGETRIGGRLWRLRGYVRRGSVQSEGAISAMGSVEHAVHGNYSPCETEGKRAGFGLPTRLYWRSAC